MVGILENPRNAFEGDRVEFVYNGKVRRGTVHRVGRTYLTLEHDCPDQYSGKIYSNYRFVKLGSRIKIFN